MENICGRSPPVVIQLRASLPSPPQSTYLALKGSHAGCVNDYSTLASLVWFILAHLPSNQADHIECAYEIHLEDGRAMM